MGKITLQLKSVQDRSYSIGITGNPAGIPAFLRGLAGINGFFLITDRNVARFHAQRLVSSLKKAGLCVETLVITPGEASKTLTTAGSLADRMLREGCDRRSCIIAFGGGVVGDLAGFVAGGFMRGIPFVQIPTTLLACVDSSVGGKTGVDLPSGKNSFGLFHQPRGVLIHPAFLATLPDKERDNGLFEAIKHGIIRDADYFRFIRENLNRLRSGDLKLLPRLIGDSCRIKADVVRRDEKESGLRRILNFGHTIGHAIESASDFRIPHGRAVGIGMLAETRAGVRAGVTPPYLLAALEDVTAPFGIGSDDIPAPGELMNLMMRDKKNTRSAGGREVRIPLVLPVRLGATAVHDFTPKELRKLLRP